MKPHLQLPNLDKPVISCRGDPADNGMFVAWLSAAPTHGIDTSIVSIDDENSFPSEL